MPTVTFPASEHHCPWPVAVYTAWWTESSRVYEQLALALLGHRVVTVELPRIELASCASLVQCHAYCATAPPPLNDIVSKLTNDTVHLWWPNLSSPWGWVLITFTVWLAPMSESWRKGSVDICVKSPVVAEERMRPGHWLIFPSGLWHWWLGGRKDIQSETDPCH